MACVEQSKGKGDGACERQHGGGDESTTVVAMAGVCRGNSRGRGMRDRCGGWCGDDSKGESEGGERDREQLT